MPALAPTEYSATITWLGRVVPDGATMRAEALEETRVSIDGFEGEVHGGRTRASCVRVTAQHPKGTEIANVRQLSIVSAEELALIARDMGMDAIDPAHLGASMVIEGIPDFTHVPPSARLQSERNGTCLTLDMENRPCVLPGREIEADHVGFGAKFKPAAKDRRGVTAWVERPGDLRVGDVMRLHVPDQRVWQP